MILFQILTYGAVLESIYSRCTKIAEMAAGTILVSLLVLANLYITGCIEFTSTAALAAAGGYFCFLTHRDLKRRWIYFGVLEVLGGMLRMNSMLMMQPMGTLLTCGVVLDEVVMQGRQGVFSGAGKSCVGAGDGHTGAFDGGCFCVLG